MPNEQITVQTTVDAPLSETWHYYTESEHVINWNFASADWHCPAAVNDLRVGGEFKITMAAKDGSMSFDLEGTYDEVDPETHIAYTLENGREVSVDFKEVKDGTKVIIKFDPEQENSAEHQREGWQSILDNFRKYAEDQAANNA
ncbi:SRPBCC domain-containing protein [Lewinella sp. JB7]|uniref:SRPBCC domain-containing protein n=1 Tax=Lewinella sp. JB7 TaxID=2962887 RepID=UPI0020CA07E8|nr:SRPBCC domain-containing protein [Lewinella sp. JB7]MCP9237837.1 SRPBCC domain-containing protein [Lewinella sp. JB7]